MKVRAQNTDQIKGYTDFNDEMKKRIFSFFLKANLCWDPKVLIVAKNLGVTLL
jgi:hypothetical protein